MILPAQNWEERKNKREEKERVEKELEDMMERKERERAVSEFLSRVSQ